MFLKCGGSQNKRNFGKSIQDQVKLFDLENVVQYEEDSVVSKTIVKNTAGTVTLFSFDEGEGLSTHTAPFDAIVSIIDGEANITIGEYEYLVKKGELIIMPANVPHSLNAEKKFKMMLTMIKENKKRKNPNYDI